MTQHKKSKKTEKWKSHNFQYYRLKIVEPDFENVYSNHSRYLIHNAVGHPKHPIEEGLQYDSPFTECDICGSLICLDKSIVVKYGSELYYRQIFCKNCFDNYFPKWKQWLINHSKWFEKRFIARYFHYGPHWNDIIIQSEIFPGKNYFPNYIMSSKYTKYGRNDDMAKNRREYEKRVTNTSHDFIFERCNKEMK